MAHADQQRENLFSGIVALLQQPEHILHCRCSFRSRFTLCFVDERRFVILADRANPVDLSKATHLKSKVGSQRSVTVLCLPQETDGRVEILTIYLQDASGDGRDIDASDAVVLRDALLLLAEVTNQYYRGVVLNRKLIENAQLPARAGSVVHVPLEILLHRVYDEYSNVSFSQAPLNTSIRQGQIFSANEMDCTFWSS